MSDPFKQAVLEHVTNGDYSEFVSKHYAPITRTVGDALRPTVAASTEAEPAPIGASKRGGLPHVPPEFEWPTSRGTASGQPLALVCQINLAEVGPHSDGALPSAGMLYLFSLHGSDYAYGGSIDDQSTAWIYLPNPGELAPAEAPAELLEGEWKGVFEERRLVFGRSFVCEEQNEGDGKPDEKRFDDSIERALAKGITEEGGRSGATRMLGPAFFFNELNREDYEPDSETLLLAVSGYEVNQSAFGEGEFLVTIGNGNLTDGELERGWVRFEGGT